MFVQIPPHPTHLSASPCFIDSSCIESVGVTVYPVSLWTHPRMAWHGLSPVSHVLSAPPERGWAASKFRGESKPSQYNCFYRQADPACRHCFMTTRSLSSMFQGQTDSCLFYPRQRGFMISGMSCGCRRLELDYSFVSYSLCPKTRLEPIFHISNHSVLTFIDVCQSSKIYKNNNLPKLAHHELPYANVWE